MTATQIDRNRSAGPDPHDGSRQATIEAIGTQLVRTLGIGIGIASDKR